MITTTYLKEIRYCRASRDYDASLDGEYIGSFATYHDAEVALDQLVSDLLMVAASNGADVEVLDTVAEQAAVTVELPGLIEHIIPICADSTVELVQRDTETNDYMALLVDGRHYDLVMCKHTVGRGAIASALLTALATVEQAIAELAAPRWQLCSSCGDMVSQAPICAACVESGEAIVAPELLAEADACLSKADMVWPLTKAFFGTADELLLTNLHSQLAARPADDGPDPWEAGVAIKRPEPRCPLCGGWHHVQRCPLIWQALRAPVAVEAVPYELQAA